MSFDAWIVGFGLSGVFRQLHFIEGNSAYLVFAAVASFDLWLLYRFFSGAQARESTGTPVRLDETSDIRRYEPTN